MSDDHFNYDQLMLDAHRDLIRQVLLKVANAGLPGNHHFFIIFKTTHHGIRLSDRLRAQYPEEMTIVLQHQYSHLKVFEDRFEIQLSFNRIPELLVIPFAAIIGFVDPSVPFGLQLADSAEANMEAGLGVVAPGLPQATMPAQSSAPEESPKTSHMESGSAKHNPEPFSETGQGQKDDSAKEGGTSVPVFPPELPTALRWGKKQDKTASARADDGPGEEAGPTKGGNIVQLDNFRKKTK